MTHRSNTRRTRKPRAKSWRTSNRRYLTRPADGEESCARDVVLVEAATRVRKEKSLLALPWLRCPPERQHGIAVRRRPWLRLQRRGDRVRKSDGDWNTVEKKSV